MKRKTLELRQVQALWCI